MSIRKADAASLYMKLHCTAPVEDVTAEFVTDTILQVVVNIDTREHRIDNSPWLMALAVERVGVLLDAENNATFASFSLVFGQAMEMVRSRSYTNRKRDARK